MKRLVLVLAILLTTSCASYMYGYTQREAENRFILVGDTADDFGRKRLGYLMGYSAPIEGFIKTHGYPEMTFETMVKNRAAIALYYVEYDEVYVFIEQSWSPDSRYLLEHRNLRDEERAAYEELTGKMLGQSI